MHNVVCAARNMTNTTEFAVCFGLLRFLYCDIDIIPHCCVIFCKKLTVCKVI